MAANKEQIKEIHAAVCGEDNLSEKLDKILEKLALLEKLESCHDALGEEIASMSKKMDDLSQSVKSKRTKMVPVQSMQVAIGGDKPSLKKEKKPAGVTPNAKFNNYMLNVDDDHKLFETVSGMSYEDAFTKYLKTAKKYSKLKKEDLPESERAMYLKYESLLKVYEKNAKDKNCDGVRKEVGKVAYNLNCVRSRNKDFAENKTAIEEHCS